MKISELIEILQARLVMHGDVPVVIDSMTHAWPPDPVLRDRGEKVLVLNG